MKKILLAILIIQSLIIISLLLYIYLKQNNVLSKISITPLKMENLIYSNPNSKLKYFYELKPSSTQAYHPSWLPYTTTYTINKDGLNERFDYSTSKASNIFRIITLGDSFTFGAFVNTPDNWTEKLEDLFQTTPFCEGKKIEVINLGVPGYDLEYMVERLKLRGIKYDPDMVIWFVKDDDFSLNNEIMTPAIHKYRDELKSKVTIDPTDYPWIVKAVKEANEKFGVQTILNHQIEVVKSIADIFKKKLVFITFPFIGQDNKRILANFSNSRPQTYLYDQLPNIYASNMSNAHLPDNHPSAEGHKLIAANIFEYLKVNKLISCQ